MIGFRELAQDYHYPVIAFDGDDIKWANTSARIFLGSRLEAKKLSVLLGKSKTKKLLESCRDNESWCGRLKKDELTAALVQNGKDCYIVVKPESAPGSANILDSMISDLGQMMKEPLNNLYSSLQEIERHLGKEHMEALGRARRSFYMLTCLSEKQIAVVPPGSVESCSSIKPLPVRELVEMAIASSNEALGDDKIFIELEGDSREHYCFVYEKKLLQLLLILFASAVRDFDKGTVTVRFWENNDVVYIEVPVRREMISVFDLSEYISSAGTVMARDTLENHMFTKIVRGFVSSHKSVIFPQKTKDGQNSIVVSIETERFSDPGVSEQPVSAEKVFGGLRPELIYLSEVLKGEHYL